MLLLTKQRRVSAGWVGIAIVLMHASGCQTQSPSAQLQKATERIISYAATAQMTLEALQNSKVSRAFATRTVTSMQQNIASETKSIQSLEVPLENKQPLIESCAQLQTALTNVNRSLQSGDSAAINPAVSQLATSNQKLKNFGPGEGFEK